MSDLYEWVQQRKAQQDWDRRMACVALSIGCFLFVLAFAAEATR